MPTQVDIANMALRRIGVSRRIADILEDSVEAQTINDCWEQERDALLESWDWPFATKRAALALIETEPNTDWGYSYQYPVDCLRAIRILAGAGMSWSDPIPFEVAWDDGRRVILCNAAEPVLQYVHSLEDPLLWPRSFADALAWRIAAEIAGPLSANAGYAANALAMATAKAAAARASAHNEQMPVLPADPDSIRARS